MHGMDKPNKPSPFTTDRLSAFETRNKGEPMSTNLTQVIVDGERHTTLGPDPDSPECEPQPGPGPGDHPGWESIERLLDEQAAAAPELAAIIEKQHDNDKAIVDEIRSDLAVARSRIAELEKALAQ